MRPYNNHSHHPLIIIAGTVIGLYLLSFLPGKFDLFGITIKKIDVLSDFKIDHGSEKAVTPAFPSTLSVVHNHRLMLSKDVDKVSKSDEEDSLSSSSIENGVVTGAGCNGNLTHFYTALQALTPAASNPIPQEDSEAVHAIENAGPEEKAIEKSIEKAGTVRVAYFGDSQIEGDLISGDLRSMLQSKFGGNGPGFIKIASEDSAFRLNYRYAFSSDWESISLQKKNTANLPIGIAGSIFVSDENSWVKYFLPGMSSDSLKINLFYLSTPEAGRVKLFFQDNIEREFTLNNSGGIQHIDLSSEGETGHIKDFKIVPLDKNVHLYGISLDGDKGVYLDNFSMRGHSGLELTKISKNTLQEFNKYFSYDLIILHFGVNIVQAGSTNYGWYEKGMMRVIEHLKDSFPESSILLISTLDRSTKDNDNLITDDSIPSLVEAQSRIAKKTNISFLNLYTAMGGRESMLNWVERGLAAKDYIHISRAGGKKIARYIYNFITKDYNSCKG